MTTSLEKGKNKGHFTNEKGGLAHLARALAWHARGNRFDSDILHKKSCNCGIFGFMPYAVYILYSEAKDRYYVGQTEDVNNRVNEHIVRKNLGADDWRVVYTEIYVTRSEAVRRESEIKSKKRRRFIESLIGTKG